MAEAAGYVYWKQKSRIFEKQTESRKTVNICFMCDLHLPFDETAIYYDVLDWAIAEIKEQKPDCIIFAGDVTCDGNIGVYRAFIEKMNGISIPFLYIPGNSDLRNPESRDEIKSMASPCVNVINGVKIFAVNDCDGTISDETYALLEQADENSVVFMHHPLKWLTPDELSKKKSWRCAHPEPMLFYGHLHLFEQMGNDVSLQAMDPDKAIGECPCITFYNTETKSLEKVYFECPMPEDFGEYLGISCYGIEEQFSFAIEQGVRCVELRSNCVYFDAERLSELVDAWRKNGGKSLSIHLPNFIGYEDGKVVESSDLDSVLEVAERIGADRLNQHAPSVPMGVVKAHPEAIAEIAAHLGKKLNQLSRTITIGVENMHMNPGAPADDTRHFGFLPEECLQFMHLLDENCKHCVGINLDVGHARNNIPYSQTYQVGTWYAQVGKHIVSYHMHQVLEENGTFENHMAITEPYGRLISYASFFRCWEDGKINKAPIVLEMRPKDAYETTLKTFGRFREK